LPKSINQPRRKTSKIKKFLNKNELTNIKFKFMIIYSKEIARQKLKFKKFKNKFLMA
jgi:hypothetical protein